MSTASPEIEQFFQQKQVSGQFRPMKWLKILHRLSQVDKAGDTKRKKIRTLMISCIILVVLSLISLAWTIDHDAWQISAGGMALGVIGAISARIWISSLKKDDLFNNLRLTAKPIMTLMQEDFLPSQKVKLEIDCKGPMQDKWLSEKIPKPRRGTLPRIGTTCFTYPWMQGAAVLKDHTQLNWELIAVVRHRNITKRGSSGKVKIKHKYKIKHRAQVRMRFSKSMYQLRTDIPDNVQVQELADSYLVKVKQVVSYSHLGPQAFESQWMPPEVFLKAVSAAYRLFQPSS